MYTSGVIAHLLIIRKCSISWALKAGEKRKKKRKKKRKVMYLFLMWVHQWQIQSVLSPYFPRGTWRWEEEEEKEEEEEEEDEEKKKKKKRQNGYM